MTGGPGGGRQGREAEGARTRGGRRRERDGQGTRAGEAGARGTDRADRDGRRRPAESEGTRQRGRRDGKGRTKGTRAAADDGRHDPTATLLSVSMPPTEQVHGDARVTPWLWGLLPDNADVLTRWGRGFGVSAASPFPLLGTQVGHDCAGAVQFCEPDEADDLLGTPGDVTWLTEAGVAARLRTLRADSTSWLGPGFASPDRPAQCLGACCRRTQARPVSAHRPGARPGGAHARRVRPGRQRPRRR